MKPPPPESASPSPVWIAGPTAVGKSAVAIELALRLNGEIVSVDSMQVYRGLEIGTAKPAAADRARVVHHLIDVAGLDESFDVARFAALARRAIGDIQHRGRVPILCGGTGFYFKALLDGVAEVPRVDPALRAELEATPLPDLLAELRQRDPAGGDRIDPANRRRVMRAVELIRLTGRPFSSLRPGEEAVRLPSPAGRGWFLVRSDVDLRARADARVDAMFAAGLVEETRRLLAAGLAANTVALQAIGYRQVAEHLAGTRALEATVALVKTKTCQFVRRQRTWFRHQLSLPWVTLDPDESPAATAARLAGLLDG